VGLVLGLSLIIVAGYTPGQVPYDPTLNIIAFALGVGLTILAMGTLWSGREKELPEDVDPIG
jgi:hypothetical protein